MKIRKRILTPVVWLVLITMLAGNYAALAADYETTPAAPPTGAAINFAGETLSVTGGGPDYKIGSADFANGGSITAWIGTEETGLVLRTKGDIDSSTAVESDTDDSLIGMTHNSDIFAFPIPARPAAPAGVAEDNGKIGGSADTTMQYAGSLSGPWTDWTSGATALTAGTYYVRYKATGSAFASATATVVIAEPLAARNPVPAQTLSVGTNAALAASAIATGGTGTLKITGIGTNTNSAIAAASTNGTAVTLTPLAAGTTNITMTVSDSAAVPRTVEIVVPITVTASAPKAKNPVPAQTVAIGGTKAFTAADIAEGGTGQLTIIQIVSAPSPAARATASLSGSTITITSPATATEGTASMVVRVRDSAATAQTVDVTVPITVTAGNNQADIDTVRNWLKWNVIRNSNPEQTNVTNTGTGNNGRYEVTSNLYLPSAGSVSRVAVTWSSSNTTALSNSGSVTSTSSAVQGVTLTATLTIAGATTAQNNALTNNTVAFYLNVMPNQVTVDAIRNWLTWEVIRGGNAQQTGVTNASGGNTSSRRYEVTANFTLQPALPAYLDAGGTGYSSSGTNRYPTEGYSVRWSISNDTTSATVNTNTGVVTFPLSGGRDVTLTAEILRNNASLSGSNRTKDFYLTIQPASADQIAVNAAINWLVWNEIRRYNDANNSTAANVTYTAKSNLALPTSYTYAPTSSANENRTVTITWSTNPSNSSYLSANGAVTPPNSSYQSVTLTAVFTCGSITGTSATNNPNAKTFSLRIERPTDTESVRMARDALTWDVIKNRNTSQNAVSSSLTLPTAGENGTTVTWSSSNTEVVSNTGTVYPPASGAASVTLTATVRKGSVSDTRAFHIVTGDERFEIEQSANSATARITADGFKKITENGTKGIDVETNLGTIRFDAAAARTIGNATSGEIAVSLSRVSDGTLPYRPVYDLAVKAGNNTLTSFSGGTATVEIAYTLGAGEDPNAVFVSYIDGAGGLHTVRSYYIATDSSGRGKVVFATGHFSRFAINYSDPINAFADIAAVNAAWNGSAKQHITFVTSRGLYNGNTLSDGSRSFGPNDSMTRAQFVAVLRNYHSGGVSAHTRNNFADANGDWYAGVIGWGEEMGIFGDYNEPNFYPNAPITRADMAYWLYNYAGKNGVKLDPVETRAFTDIGGFSQNYRTAIQTLANADVISGDFIGFDRVYRPNDTSTRAEVAAIIAKFVRAFKL